MNGREHRHTSRIEEWAQEQARRIREQRRDLDDRDERQRIELRRRIAARFVGPFREVGGGAPS